MVGFKIEGKNKAYCSDCYSPQTKEEFDVLEKVIGNEGLYCEWCKKELRSSDTTKTKIRRRRKGKNKK